MPSPQLFCTSLHLRHWRNFKGPLDVELRRRVFLLGANASGKSNFLDALRFFRDIATDGLQKAVKQRGGMKEMRTLHATSPAGIEMGLCVGSDRAPKTWKYRLRFHDHPKKQRTEVMKEEVWHRGKLILRRPDAEDKKDRDRRTQTYLEQTAANQKFRELNRFLQSIRYRHIIPQFVRAPRRSTGRHEDPFGSDFLEKMGSLPRKSRDARLHRINRALKVAIPQFESLNLQQDAGGRWHLEMRFSHWGADAAPQYERDFSDGALRLIGLLWALTEDGGPLLLEEPELGLNDVLVRRLAPLMARLYEKTGRQTLISTHSIDLLSDKGIGMDEVYLLEPEWEGTAVRAGSSYPDILPLVEEGDMPPGEALMPQINPERGSFFDL